VAADGGVKRQVACAQHAFIAAGPPEFAEAAQFLNEFGRCAVAHGPFDGQPLQRFAEFVDFTQLRDARLPQFVAGIGGSAHQFLLFEADQRLAHRGPRHVIPFRQHIAGQSATGLEYPVPNLFADRFTHLFRRASMFCRFHRRLPVALQ